MRLAQEMAPSTQPRVPREDSREHRRPSKVPWLLVTSPRRDSPGAAAHRRSSLRERAQTPPGRPAGRWGFLLGIPQPPRSPGTALLPAQSLPPPTQPAEGLPGGRDQKPRGGGWDCSLKAQRLNLDPPRGLCQDSCHPLCPRGDRLRPPAGPHRLLGGLWPSAEPCGQRPVSKEPRDRPKPVW